ncbi:MAG: hypothetical protein IKD73_03035 [Selenomonadaceae bacterium]|nr:hypothetical protein [Selenomonadaceae bacterium]
MKRFLIAAAASLLIFGGQVEASTADLDKPIETQEIGSGKWAHFRDKYILGRETENERRDRKEWERRHREDRRRYRDDYRYTPPNPPPYYRDGRRYYPPPRPPQYQRDSRRYYPPNQPPTRYR